MIYYILYVLTWPLLIIVSYYAVMWVIRKYDPVFQKMKTKSKADHS